MVQARLYYRLCRHRANRARRRITDVSFCRITMDYDRHHPHAADRLLSAAHRRINGVMQRLQNSLPNGPHNNPPNGPPNGPQNSPPINPQNSLVSSNCLRNFPESSRSVRAAKKFSNSVNIVNSSRQPPKPTYLNRPNSRPTFSMPSFVHFLFILLIANHGSQAQNLSK